MSPKDFILKSWMCERAANALSVRHAKDYGVLIQRSNGWWASNDVRWDLIGLVPNQELTAPTVGPFGTFKAAFEAFERDKPLMARP